MKTTMKHTEHSKQKISAGLKLAYKNGSRTNKPPMLGKKHSDETRAKMSEAAKNRIALNPHTLPDPTGKIKENAGYQAIHAWARKYFGEKVRCENCGATEHLDWANKDGQYTRNRDDWFVLCRSCHMKYDRENGIWKHARFA